MSSVHRVTAQNFTFNRQFLKFACKKSFFLRRLWYILIAMKKRELVKKTIDDAGGIARTADLVAAGVSKTLLDSMVADGELVRIRHGYYRIADEKNYVPEPRYLKTLLPEGVVCMYSALFYHGYSDFTPRQWDVAVPRNIALSRLRFEDVPIQPYFVRQEIFDIGITTMEFEGIELPIYDRERTICDCFRYYKKLDRETFVKAVKNYALDERQKIPTLTRYARALGVYQPVFKLMGVLIGS